LSSTSFGALFSKEYGATASVAGIQILWYNWNLRSSTRNRNGCVCGRKRWLRIRIQSSLQSLWWECRQVAYPFYFRPEIQTTKLSSSSGVFEPTAANGTRDRFSATFSFFFGLGTHEVVQSSMLQHIEMLSGCPGSESCSHLADTSSKMLKRI